VEDQTPPPPTLVVELGDDSSDSDSSGVDETNSEAAGPTPPSENAEQSASEADTSKDEAEIGTFHSIPGASSEDNGVNDSTNTITWDRNSQDGSHNHDRDDDEYDIDDVPDFTHPGEYYNAYTLFGPPLTSEIGDGLEIADASFSQEEAVNDGEDQGGGEDDADSHLSLDDIQDFIDSFDRDQQEEEEETTHHVVECEEYFDSEDSYYHYDFDDDDDAEKRTKVVGPCSNRSSSGKGSKGSKNPVRCLF
jgi:hypothetical protein